MKLNKILSLLFVTVLALVLVACGPKNDTPEVDPLVPTGISIKVKTAKVQINSTIKISYAITPATAQDNAVTITLNNSLATYAKEGNKTIALTAGSETGSVKVTIETTNGIKASKTIKIQLEEVQSYPDLCGYNIKLAQAVQALGEYDVKLTKETEETYDYYDKADRNFKAQAWDEMEENYNCSLTVVAYPSDAPWGPSRWQYILTQAQNDSPEYDFYVIPYGVISSFVAGNAILDLTDWYAEYGKSIMNDLSIASETYKQRLYALNDTEINIYNLLGYNVGLLERIQKIDDTIEEPAQMFLDGKWNYDTFKAYCIKVQTALNTLAGEGEKYYCLSGYGTYYWLGMVNASGVKVLDVQSLKVNMLGEVEMAAAKTMQDIYAAGCMDPAFSVDQSVASWNAGHALFDSGDYWFVNTPNRWNKKLWGSEEDTRYGYVPYPGSADVDPSITYVGSPAEACIVMAAGREWAYAGFGEECTSENIYRAYMDYITSARQYYTTSEEYNYEEALRVAATERFATEASVKAYLKVMLGTKQEDGTYVGGIREYGFFDPFVDNSNGVVGNCGNAGTFAGGINAYIKGSINQWVDAVGAYESTINQALVEKYG